MATSRRRRCTFLRHLRRSLTGRRSSRRRCTLLGHLRHSFTGRRSSRRRGNVQYSLPLAGLALGLFGLLAVSRLGDAQHELSLARSALEQARSAVATRQVETAEVALDQAGARLEATGRQAGRWPLSLVRRLPLVGSPVVALVAGVEAGQEVVAAGHILAEAANSLPTSGGASLDGHDLSALNGAARSSQEAITEAGVHLSAAKRVLRGPAGALLPPVSAPARALLGDLERAEGQLAAAGRGLRLLGRLTDPATEARLLLLSQDSMELRPTGGFVGSFGVLRVSHGTVALERYESFEVLDDANPPMDPPEDLAGSLDRPWDISNANWWPDFPTSARTATELFRRQGGGEVDGVIAITEHAMARLVGALGPIQLPGYAQPVVEEGFGQRVLYEVELKRPLDKPRKRFLTLLADEVFHRLFQLPAEQVPRVAEALGRSAGTGDLQVWFARSDWQADVSGSALDGALPAADPSGDFLFLNEANLTASKANGELLRRVNYSVAPGSEGRLEATLRIDYRNQGVESEINPYYNGLVHVYVPKGSEITGDQGEAVDAPDGPYTMLISSVYVAPEGHEVLTFRYLLPKGVAPGGKYRLSWLRQTGTPRDVLIATVGGRSFEAGPGGDLAVEARFRRGFLARLLPWG
jgi:hypothetical protein